MTRCGSRWLLNFCYLVWHLYAKMGKCIYFQMPRKVYTVAWPSGLRRWFLRRRGFDSHHCHVFLFIKWTIRQYFLHKLSSFFSFFTFLFLLSLIFHQKKKTYKQWEEKAKANRDTREKTPTQRQRKNVANVWNPLLHGTFWHLNIPF